MLCKHEQFMNNSYFLPSQTLHLEKALSYGKGNTCFIMI